jgi:post-segregation antitoxin (ccd killing protein)
MQITLTIPDELAVQAKTRGISVEEYVQRLLEEAGRNSPALQESRTVPREFL